MPTPCRNQRYNSLIKHFLLTPRAIPTDDDFSTRLRVCSEKSVENELWELNSVHKKCLMRLCSMLDFELVLLETARGF